MISGKDMIRAYWYTSGIPDFLYPYR